jgi:hypothetical protein
MAVACGDLLQDGVLVACQLRCVFVELPFMI